MSVSKEKVEISRTEYAPDRIVQFVRIDVESDGVVGPGLINLTGMNPVYVPVAVNVVL